MWLMYRSVYLDREDAKSVEEEERNLFLKGVLEKVGVPLNDVWPDILLTVEQKRRLRDLLCKLEIEIIDNGDRGYEIYHQNTQLAKWHKPKFILREDKRARSQSKKLFFEMLVKTESVFDTEDEETVND
jgi:hypothetical protein